MFEAADKAVSDKDLKKPGAKGKEAEKGKDEVSKLINDMSEQLGNLFGGNKK